MRTVLSILVLVAGTTLIGCNDTTAPGDATFLYAELSGAVTGAYAGSAAYTAGPAFLSAPFSIRSAGIGESSNQGFTFESTEALSAGEYRLGELAPSVLRATYWYDAAGMRRLYRVTAGVLVVSSSSRATGSRAALRAAGTFQGTATLLYVCDMSNAGPGSVVLCDPATEPAAVEFSGSFDAGPLGEGGPDFPHYP
jgi:hypothetical protein